jgi:hypothetical protein
VTSFAEIRVARKRHIPGTRTGGCESCRSAIEPGETYARWTATPNDAEVNQSDHWSHLKAHHPYGSCPKFAQRVEVSREQQQ